MKSSSRGLLIFGVAIGVLVIVAIVLVLTVAKPGETSLLPEDAPGGTVQRYFLALEDGKYLTAYSYLSPPADEKLTYEKWHPSVSSGEKPAWQVTLGEAVVEGDEATVDVEVKVFRPGDPFDNPVDTYHITFFLKQEGTSWKITSPTYLWWFLY